jgi:hypothetical protein
MGCDHDAEPSKPPASIAVEALTWAIEMLEARDVMNAKVHCAPVRYSPLTARCREAWEALTGERWANRN